jgi:hypothetical protein
MDVHGKVALEDWDAVIGVNLRGAFCCPAGRGPGDARLGSGRLDRQRLLDPRGRRVPRLWAILRLEGRLRILMRDAAVELAGMSRYAEPL